MTRNLKVLGLALVAALAMSAVAASAASATPFEFHSEASSTVLTGSQEGTDVFTTDAGTVSCGEANYIGSQSAATTTTVSVLPTYSNCTAFGFISVPIVVNGCEYLFHAGTASTTGEPPVTHYEGTADVVCPAGKVIEVKAPGCTVTVGSQTGLQKVTYTNKEGGGFEDVTVDVNMTGIKYEEHNKGLFPTCANNTVPKSNGTYTGAATVTGDAGGGQVNIWVE
jgi:hypothetical protein